MCSMAKPHAEPWSQRSSKHSRGQMGLVRSLPMADRAASALLPKRRENAWC